MLYLHGGGYIVGSPSSHRGLMSSIAVRAGVRCLGIDYRLAPEHPCPASLEDALSAYRRLLLDIPPERIAIAGDSAGGGLCATTLVQLRDEGLPMPAGAVMLSPWTDLRASASEGLVDLGYDYIFPDSDRARSWGGEYGRVLGCDHPLVSPVTADLRGLPPCLILTGELELLARDNLVFAARLRDAGVDVMHHVEPDEVHVYPAFHELSPRAAAGLGRVAQFLASVYRAAGRRRSGGTYSPSSLERKTS